MPCAVYHCWLLACLQYHDDGLFGACSLTGLVLFAVEMPANFLKRPPVLSEAG